MREDGDAPLQSLPDSLWENFLPSFLRGCDWCRAVSTSGFQEWAREPDLTHQCTPPASQLCRLVYRCPGNPSRAKETWSWVLAPTGGEETAVSFGVASLVECNSGVAPGSFASSWGYKTSTEESGRGDP